MEIAGRPSRSDTFASINKWVYTSEAPSSDSQMLRVRARDETYNRIVTPETNLYDWQQDKARRLPLDGYRFMCYFTHSFGNL